MRHAYPPVGLKEMDSDAVAHDTQHSVDTYRDAIEAINSDRLGEDGSVARILAAVDCPACFGDALVSIASRLGDAEQTVTAAANALAHTFTLTGEGPPEMAERLIAGLPSV